MGHILAEDPCQETGPAEAVDRLGHRGLLGVGAGFRGPFVRPRHDAVAIGGIGREYAVITDKVEARRPDKSGELLDQLQRRKDQVGGPVGPRGFEFETERVVVKSTELTCGQWRPYNVAAQALEAGSLIGLDAGRPMKNVGTDYVRVAFAGSRSEAQGPGEVMYLKVKPSRDAPLRLSLDQVYLNGWNLTPEFAPEVTAAVVIDDDPLVYALHQNAPNPFNPDTTIRYELPETVDVRLVVYSLTGQEVRTLISSRQDAGRYQITWDGHDAQGRQVGSGLYLLRMAAGSFRQTRRMVLLK